MAMPTAGAGGGGSGGAKLVDRTAQQQQAANLAMLQRKDEAVSEILATATYVVMYLYDTATQQWTRKDIEGSLFVVKRSFGCRFRLIILNRQSNQDLEEDLTASISIEEMDPYLLYRSSAPDDPGSTPETHAIWFHSAKERSSIYSCLRRVLRNHATVVQLEKKEGGPLPSSTSASSGTPSVGAPKEGGGGVIASPLLQPQQLIAASKAQDSSQGPVPSLSKSLKDLLLKGSATNGGGGTDHQRRPTVSPPSSELSNSGSGKASPPPGPTTAPPNLLQQLLLKSTTVTTTTAVSVSPPSSGVAAPSPPQPPNGLLAALLKSPPQQQQQPPGGVVMTKGQLKTVLMDLIQDDSFIELLHGAYLTKLRKGSAAEEGGEPAS